MDGSRKDISLALYECLCKSIGTEEVVKLRRQIFCSCDVVVKTPEFTYISSGSKAEGLDLQGSDFDLMQVLHWFPVYENVDKIPASEVNTCLIIDNRGVKPGFTRLKVSVGKDGLSSELNAWCDIYPENLDLYISNKAFKEYHLNIVEYNQNPMSLHGPCVALNDMFDIAMCFHCNGWIEPAIPWIYRPRTSWPPNEVINSAVQYGTLFVPIGVKGSLNEPFEFRVSFSAAEKILIHSFSHTQLFCYALLKIVLKEFIKIKHGDILCSYFLKTIVFWVSEELQTSTWRSENLLSCFLNCFQRLIYCIRYRTCLHFFIPEYNLFQGLFEESEHEKLLETLNTLHDLSWRMFLFSDTLKAFRILLMPSPCKIVPTVSALSVLDFFNFTGLCKGNMYRAVNGFHYNPGKQFYVLHLSMISQRIAMQKLSNDDIRNKKRYRTHKNRIAHHLLGTHHDSVSGWLTFATYFYGWKQYRACLKIVNYCLTKCTPDKVRLSSDMDISDQNRFNEEMTKITTRKSFRFIQAYRKMIVTDIEFNKGRENIPAELTIFKDKFRVGFLHFPPVVFALLLSGLCFYHQKDKRNMVKCFRDINWTIREQYLIGNKKSDKDICYNCMSMAKALLKAN